MKKNILRMVETAVMLALLVAVQAVTKPLGQLVTGSLVNCVLAVTALAAGLPGGLTVALVSPVLAYLLDIAPSPFAVPVIMVGNAVLVTVLWLVERKGSILSRILSWLSASAAKFAVMYALMNWVVCGLLADSLDIKPKMAEMLSATFSWLQLITALVGTAVALAIVPVLRKAIKR